MDADDETAALVLQLQSEDIGPLFAHAESESNSNNGAANDQAYAYRLYQQELETQRTILNDRQLGQRIARTIRTDQQTLMAAVEAENAARRRRNFTRGTRQPVSSPDAAAASVAGPSSSAAISSASPATKPLSADETPVVEPSLVEKAPPATESVSASEYASAAESACGGSEADAFNVVNPADDDNNKSKHEKGLLSEAIALYKVFTGALFRPAQDSVSHATADGTSTPDEPSTPDTDGAIITYKGKAPATDNDSRPSAECAVCFENKPLFDIATVPCGCNYCRDCLDRLFNDSLIDEAFFPPRCCRQPIPFEDVRLLLTAGTARDFGRKRPELETADRTYCCQPTCSAWISPASITEGDSVGTCLSCGTRTCTVCKAKAHSGEDCPEDEATQSLLRVVEENNWQRCYSCRRFVEMTTGCYHMKCRCKAEFCYLCGEKWKSCRCRTIDEHHLLERARQVVQRSGQTGTRADVQRVARHLRENHECTHEHFTTRHGSHRCEECNFLLPSFILECQQCMLHLCRRCRMNRL